MRDAVHPLSPGGLYAYDYALSDSLAIRTAAGEVTVYQVQVRPRDFSRPLVVGNLYIDVATAELVRFRFSFTPAAYLDRQLEDISVVLESALYENRYWLPRRQEVEIRRRVTWLDFPARGIIRGRWEIGDYELNPSIPDRCSPARRSADCFGRATRIRPGPSRWTRQSLTWPSRSTSRTWRRLRVEVDRLAGSRALGGLPARRLAAGSLSDLVRVNRVQGLTLGFGANRRAGRYPAAAPAGGQPTVRRTTGSPARSRWRGAPAPPGSELGGIATHYRFQRPCR